MLIRAAGKRISEKLARHFIEIAGIDAAFVKHTAVAPFLHIDGVGDQVRLALLRDQIHAAADDDRAENRLHRRVGAFARCRQPSVIAHFAQPSRRNLHVLSITVVLHASATPSLYGIRYNSF